MSDCCCGGHAEKHDVPKPQKEWFCPMCAGVESDRPGHCPICGMALERNPAFAGGADDQGDPELRDMTRRFVAGAILALPILVLAMGPHFGFSPFSAQVSAWVQCILSLPVVLWAGWPFLERGARSFATRRLNMFTLIAVGTSAAFLFSLAVLIFPSFLPHDMHDHGMTPVYFEAAAAIIVLVLLGQVLELRARAKAGGAIRALLDLAPATAHRVADGVEDDLPLAAVRVGEVLRVRPGEKIPVDGTVLDGSSFADESMLSGEVSPVAKAAGAKVIAGTMNGSGTFTMRVEKVGADTLLAHIVQLVADAQRSRAPAQRVADAVAAWFVPAVIGVAIVTFAVWLFFGPEPAVLYALVNSVAVLIIACPCALGLATPMSITVAVGRGAGMGVLARDAASLEMVGKIRTLVVDKTGTLTEGRPSVIAIRPAPGWGEQDILTIAAAAESPSEHPLARAVVRAAREQKLQLPAAVDFEAVPGSGVFASVDGRSVIVGQHAFLVSRGVAGPERLDPSLPAGSVVWIAVDGNAAGVLVISDPVKATAREAVEELQTLGIHVVMMTGDRAEAAQAVAEATGIGDVFAGLSPAQKQEKVVDLRATAGPVGMAGDGINDGPALAAADVGIAMGTGTDVAIEASGITLVRGDLRGIVRAVRLSRATVRNIRQNLVFAFLYNALGVPIAAGVLYPFFGILLSPVIASAAMALSSVSVITNALRLRTRHIG